MYAMLTGSLPFTVEPFNISVLHAKMLDNKMNPIPERLSASTCYLSDTGTKIRLLTQVPVRLQGFATKAFNTETRRKNNSSGSIQSPLAERRPYSSVHTR
jgi:hypothetical protein